MRSSHAGWAVWFALGAAALGANQVPAVPAAAEINVNSRYVVERVDISGLGGRALSARVLDQIRTLTGERFSQAAIDDLIRAIRSDLHATRVTQTVLRGSQPDHVRVVLEAHRRTVRFEANVPHFVYQSKQGWSAGAEGAIQTGAHTIGGGVRSDGDELIERFAGVTARYENRHLGTDRIGFRFEFEDYHQQWNQATLDSLRGTDIPGIYRTRSSLNPTLTVALAPPLTLYAGASFDSLETQFPAARNQSSNAVVSTLRYHRRLEDSDSNKHDLDASYNLRAATNLLGSDFVYARRSSDLRPVSSPAARPCSNGSPSATARLSAAGTSGRSIPRAGTGWSTIPSNTVTGYSKRSTTPVRSGTGAGLRPSGTRLAWVCARTCFPWRLPSR
jgi:hypothetical protein